jgi:predicted ATPase
LLARHCTEAGLIEKAAHLWGRAAQRSVERSALVEAIAQFTRALDQMETLPTTPALRREEIELQVALITPLIHVKGYAAPETTEAVERARLLIEKAEALGEPPEDPLLLFSVLYGLWVVKLVALDGDAMRQLATQFLELAEKHGRTPLLMMGHRLTGVSLMLLGDIAQSRTHLDEAIALFNPATDRPLAARFGNDPGITSLGFRARSLWLLGFPDAALADTEHAVRDAREIGQAATLMLALFHASLTHLLCGDYTAANIETDELIALANETTAAQWKAQAVLNNGCVLVATGRPADAVQMIDPGVTAYRSTGSTIWLPLTLSYLGVAHAELHRFDDAWRCIGEAVTAVETTKEKWSEAEINRMAGEIALKSPTPDTAKAQGYFDRALRVARAQQAKSWELRAAMSMARIWRDQGKRDEARELLAPVYDWFTEGFDTRDLKEAKVLLDELAA